MNGTTTKHPRQIDFSFWIDSAPFWAVDARMDQLMHQHGPEIMIKVWDRVKPMIGQYLDAKTKIYRGSMWFWAIIAAGAIFQAGSFLLPFGNDGARIIALLSLWAFALCFHGLIQPLALRRLKRKHNLVIEV